MADSNGGINFYLKVRDEFSNTLGSFSNKLRQAQNPLGNLKRGIQNFNPKFSSGNLGSFNNSLKETGSLMKSLTGANLISSGISKGFDVAKNSASSFYGELNESTEAWGTFNNNMQMIGQGQKEIDSTRQDLQNYAQATIYSSSDMASSYSQLSASGVKNADSLVKGFGGLASTAGDSKQAMKSLSEQSIQAAAQPQIKWEDFRIMMQQAPAGMTQVAKSMGMSMQDMIKQVQSGKIQTQDFFNAVSKTGNSKQLTHMASQYKTISQATDGLREETANKLQPVFQKSSGVIIKAISNVIDSFSSLNVDKYAKPISNALQGMVNGISSGFNYAKSAVTNFLNGFKNTQAITSMQNAMKTVQGSIQKIQSSGGKGKSPFTFLGQISGNTISGLAKAIGAISSTIASMNPSNLKALAVAVVALKSGTKGLALGGLVWFLNTLNKQNPQILDLLSKNITKIAWALIAFKAVKGLGGAVSGIASLFNVMGKFRGSKTPSVPKVPAPTNVGSWLKFGTGMIMVGGALILAGTGMYILANASIKLASGGGMAIAVFAGMAVAIGALIAIVATFGTALSAGSLGIIAFGAGMALIGVAVWVACNGIANLAGKLPQIAQFGTSAGASLIALSGGLLATGLAGIVGAVGALAFGSASLVLGAGLAVVGAGLILVGVGLNTTANGLQNLANIVGSIFNSIVTTAQIGIDTFKNAISSGMQGAVNVVKGFISSFTNAGANLMQGLKSGISNTVGRVIDEITGVSSKIMNKVKTMLGIHSPSKVFAQYGNYLNLGMANGLKQHSNIAPDQAGNIAQDIAVQGNPANANVPNNNPNDNSTNNSNNTNDRSSNDNSIVIQSGAIQINGSSGESGKEIVAQLESYLQNLQEGRLT